MLNKVTLIGNLGADPETRYMPNGDAVTNISLATTRRWKDKTTGEKKEATEWHRIIFFNNLAKIIGEYCKKGSKVYIEGRLQTRKWTGKDGQDNYTTEIIAQEIILLGSRSGGSAEEQAKGRPVAHQQAPAPQHNPNAMPSPPMPDYDDFDDDIPF